MKTAANPLYILLAGVILSSCQMKTYTTTDPRFPQVFGREIRTKHTLRLYPINRDLTGELDHHLITESLFQSLDPDENEIGVLPVGHPVVFDKLMRERTPDYVAESLFGKTLFRGTTYPVCFKLGWLGDESNSGWKGIYYSFDVPKP